MMWDQARIHYRPWVKESVAVVGRQVDAISTELIISYKTAEITLGSVSIPHIHMNMSLMSESHVCPKKAGVSPYNLIYSRR